MPAIARFEAGARDGQRTIMADVDRMRAAEPTIAAAEPGKRRFVDCDGPNRIVGGEDTFLAVAEPALAHFEVAVLEADSGTVCIGHTHVGEDQTFDPRRTPAQHQRSLA